MVIGLVKKAKKLTKTGTIFLGCSCAFFTSCGQEVKNTGADDVTNTQSLSGVDTFSVRAKRFRNQSIEAGRKVFDRFAVIRIPRLLNVISGNAGYGLAKVYFNKRGSQFDFYCLFQGNASTPQPGTLEDIEAGLEYSLFECYNDNDEYIDFQAGDEFPIDLGNSIEVEILSADPRFDTTVDSQFEVTWI